jgi:sirohydrochlorin cobaltochelatase
VKNSTGLVLFGHGARDQRWREPFDRLQALVEARYPGAVSLAFLDSMSPDLVTACNDLARRGAQRIVVVPLFLGTGGHLRADLPELVAAARNTCTVPVSVVEAVGEDRRVLEALADYCLRAVG